jgi:hypothetical protein
MDIWHHHDLHLRARTRKAGSRRWRRDVSWLMSGLGGKLSCAHWRRYRYVAVRGATAKRSLYFFSSNPATCRQSGVSPQTVAVHASWPPLVKKPQACIAPVVPAAGGQYCLPRRSGRCHDRTSRCQTYWQPHSHDHRSILDKSTKLWQCNL